jgi:hypothetical protein
MAISIIPSSFSWCLILVFSLLRLKLIASGGQALRVQSRPCGAFDKHVAAVLNVALRYTINALPTPLRINQLFACVTCPSFCRSCLRAAVNPWLCVWHRSVLCYVFTIAGSAAELLWSAANTWQCSALSTVQAFKLIHLCSPNPCRLPIHDTN